MNKFVLLVGDSPYPPCRENPERGEWNLKNGWSQKKFVLDRLNAKILFGQLHMLDRSLDSCITFYSWVITLILFTLFTYYNVLKIIWLEPNVEVTLQTFYITKLMKNGTFSKWRGGERGDNKFQAFGSVTQKGGDMYYWWD